MNEILHTTHGSFEAFVRKEGIDVVSSNGHAETFDKYNAVAILKQRRRFAQKVVSFSQRARCLLLGASFLEVASGLVNKDPQKIVKGLAGIGVSRVLYANAEPYFQAKADLAGIQQEVIEISR